ncbi:GNAT family N-acetyltransferase [Microbacterium sp.]|uniref:GNAT family N-acetyltransferase n=1 Tax=Microbacterium sp. TaxID=51671 RepID=UPI0039E5E1D3
MPVQSAPTVTRNDERHRYEIHLDDLLAGYLDYYVDARGRLVIHHTLIDHAFEGRGLGTVLAAGTAADLAERGETVVPTCPFFTRYLKSHEVPGLSIVWADETTPGPSASAVAG